MNTPFGPRPPNPKAHRSPPRPGPRPPGQVEKWQAGQETQAPSDSTRPQHRPRALPEVGQQEGMAGGRPPGHTPATTYLAPDLVDDGDQQQEAAQGQEHVLGVVQHRGQQHQLQVELLQGLALHGPPLRRENGTHVGWGHTRPCPPGPSPISSLQGHTERLHFPGSLAVGRAT